MNRYDEMMKNDEEYNTSDEEEWQDASDSDWENYMRWNEESDSAEWWCGVESDSTIDADDGNERLDGEYDSDLSEVLREYWCEEECRDGSREEEKTEQQLREEWGVKQPDGR